MPLPDWRRQQLLQQQRQCRTMSLLISVTNKKSPNVYKNCPKMISLEKWNILTRLRELPKMWAIWAKFMLPQASKSCPKCNKSPNLVTLLLTYLSLSLLSVCLCYFFLSDSVFCSFSFRLRVYLSLSISFILSLVCLSFLFYSIWLRFLFPFLCLSVFLIICLIFCHFVCISALEKGPFLLSSP